MTVSLPRAVFPSSMDACSRRWPKSASPKRVMIHEPSMAVERDVKPWAQRLPYKILNIRFAQRDGPCSVTTVCSSSELSGRP
jgi:hypothetical protein